MSHFKKAGKLLKAYWNDESGQTSTEYILLIAVVAMIVYKFKEQIEAKLFNDSDSVMNKVFSDRFNKILE